MNESSGPRSGPPDTRWIHEEVGLAKTWRTSIPKPDHKTLQRVFKELSPEGKNNGSRIPPKRLSTLKLLSKQRMRYESGRSIHLVSQNFRGLVSIFFAALVAANREWFLNRWPGCHSVGFPEGNSVYVEGVRMVVKPVILANDHPAILSVGPDSVSGIDHFVLNRFSGFVRCCPARGTVLQ
jgi:hypothetical protein